ncbi:MAG: DUF3995 domain-containing protein [Psychrosphaera sp.]|nr:DUF3995 domain-containing protein [Psychrosphaera sp.]
MVTLSIVVSSVMLLVSLLHFYWAFGGQYGLRSAGPSLESGKNFIPSRLLTSVVACLLSGLAVLSVQLVWPWQPFKSFIHYIGYFVSFIFIIRGIGDFKYVGLFKKVYNSNFAKLDTKYFSPLIILLGIAYGLLSKYGV